MSDETERADERFRNLEALPSRTLLEALIGGQDEALRAVRDALPRIDAAVDAAAGRLGRPQARLAYCGAGTSGRLAMLDGVELGPTFSWPAERCVYLLAGGTAAFSQAREGAEDEESAAHTAIREAGIGRDDVVVALAASGRTPYTIAAVRSARERGALTIGFANNPGTPLLDVSEHPVLLRTGPEVLAGSTRLAAGTAQKAALNLFSTAVMVRLGKVFRGRMVDMRPSNRKLRERARRMVAEVAGCDEADAEAALQATGGAIREAILKLEARNGVSRGAAPAAGDAATGSAGADGGAGPSAPARIR
ncbi:N-acetylmuramic acid 6-phosphate etherase [Aureimonas jatrophae]|uniref:N-acetylmuramic acid 6-phosphate etherase n=1 Tax=Aureimonas jatrophae TaxID=1166073 RepID=A0A1H0IEB1_9HYPH|nr:N-acetylmuramic acid 6-phosphate etherase [Aureimonas jatrophae]MBB3952120.1 N-acetylmuramic acid 6-phosphate etherase [Aureimonas jatrophae]SDO29733.1 N-acetylmuramic acid 6-phosphate etherase [Aureimonas jatrophae]